MERLNVKGGKIQFAANRELRSKMFLGVVNEVPTPSGIYFFQIFTGLILRVCQQSSLTLTRVMCNNGEIFPWLPKINWNLMEI